MKNAGTVYTETVVHSAPEQFVNEAPYQLVIVVFDAEEGGGRLTARVAGPDRVSIGDRVVFDHERDGIRFYRKIV
jgi:uncharacterized OB-fold protein